MTQQNGQQEKGQSRIRLGSAPDSWGGLVPRRPGAGALSAVPRRGQRLRLRMDRAGALRLPAHRSGAAGRRAPRPGAPGERRHRVRAPAPPGLLGRGLGPGRDVAPLTAAMGGTHVVVIPDTFCDQKTEADVESRHLTPEAWRAKTTGVDRLGRAAQEEYGLSSAYHPHAESHVGWEADVERFVPATDPT